MSKFEKCIVISDSHGYHDLFVRLLAEVGIVDGVIPPHIQLIHLGDTVDRGPDSPGVFNLLRDMQANHPEGQVIRLIGNHEFCYCGGPVFYQSPEDEAAVTPLADAMIEDGKAGKLGFAYALTAGGKDWLCVHGGLDPRLLAEDDDSSAQELADHINEVGIDFFNHAVQGWRYKTGLTTEQREQQMALELDSRILTAISRVRGGYDLVSGVTWCDIIEELVPQQDKIKVPQIVGHRAHPQITIYPSGKLVGVNLYYGEAQALIVDLETGEMTTTDLLGEQDPNFL